MTIDLTGNRTLSGVSHGEMSRKNYAGETERVQAVVITLDGKHYAFVEDPSDGYRSYCEGVVEIDKAPAYSFPPQPVRVTEEGDYTVIRDPETNSVILRVGTDHDDDYYPTCVMDYCPENLAINRPVHVPLPPKKKRRGIQF